MLHSVGLEKGTKGYGDDYKGTMEKESEDSFIASAVSQILGHDRNQGREFPFNNRPVGQ